MPHFTAAAPPGVASDNFRGHDALGGVRRGCRVRAVAAPPGLPPYSRKFGSTSGQQVGSGAGSRPRESAAEAAWESELPGASVPPPNPGRFSRFTLCPTVDGQVVASAPRPRASWSEVVDDIEVVMPGPDQRARQDPPEFGQRAVGNDDAGRCRRHGHPGRGGLDKGGWGGPAIPSALTCDAPGSVRGHAARRPAVVAALRHRGQRDTGAETGRLLPEARLAQARSAESASLSRCRGRPR